MFCNFMSQYAIQPMQPLVHAITTEKKKRCLENGGKKVFIMCAGALLESWDVLYIQLKISHLSCDVNAY